VRTEHAVAHDASHDAVIAMVGEHGTVEFDVVTHDACPVVGRIWPEGSGYHVRCAGLTASCTKRPVRLEFVAMQTAVLLADFGLDLSDATFRAARAEFGSNDQEIAYFIQDEGGPIKIGKTRGSAKERMHSLQIGNPRRLRLLATTAAHAEAALHRRFAADSISGEWFRPSTELVAFIASLETAS
jgi:hypothetical protein